MDADRRSPRGDVSALELVGGPEPIEVVLTDYDPRWVDIYRTHRDRIRDALAPADVEIEHIGSTSVPGLAAKPIVDVVVAVPDITDEESYLHPLLGAGYLLRVREPGHRLVRTPARDVHVHIYERGADAIDRYLLLRDRLRADADDRTRYEAVKRALLQTSWSDMNDYAAAKTDIIRDIMDRARAARSQGR